jgi:hypothetical protein
MAMQFRIWLYGSRPKVKSKKKISKKKKVVSSPSKLVRLADDEFRYAKGFHFYVKKSPRSKWIRVTDSIELFPTGFRSILDKQIYIESFQSAIEDALSPKKEVALPLPESKAEPLKLPDLPEEPKVSITKKQFYGQMGRIILDELGAENIKWSDKRIDNFIDKLWRNYSHAPHLLVSEEFRRGLMTQEIVKLKKAEAKKKRLNLKHKFIKELVKQGLTDNTDIGGKVEIKFKEVFNFRNMKKPDDETITVLKDVDGFTRVVEEDRQKSFAEVIATYDKMMFMDKTDLSKKKPETLEKVRADIKKLFNEAVEKELFRLGDDELYSVRLVVPLVMKDGTIPNEYLNRHREKVSGHGYGTTRMEIKNENDINKLIDSMFESMHDALIKYIRFNNAAGIAVSGFMIERVLS